MESVLAPALRHRIALNFEGQSEGIVVEDLIAAAADAAKAALAFDQAIASRAVGAVGADAAGSAYSRS